VAGKVTVGLALHWPCVTDNSGITTYGLMALGREMSTPPITSRSVAQFTLPCVMLSLARCFLLENRLSWALLDMKTIILNIIIKLSKSRGSMPGGHFSIVTAFFVYIFVALCFNILSPSSRFSLSVHARYLINPILLHLTYSTKQTHLQCVSKTL